MEINFPQLDSDIPKPVGHPDYPDYHRTGYENPNTTPDPSAPNPQPFWIGDDGNNVIEDQDYSYSIIVGLYASTTFQTVSHSREAGKELFGRGGDDILRGYGGGDTLRGEDNNDTLDGGPGGDILDGGAGIDTATYQGASEFVVADLMWPGLNQGEAKGDSYIRVENLVGSTHADHLGGDDKVNEIWGGPGNDLIAGRGDSDILHGDGGADTLIGDQGNDTLWGGEDSDTLQGGENNDELHGGEQGDVLYGEDGEDVLEGDQGADTLYGGIGNDILKGGGDVDWMYGGADDDELHGGEQADILYGEDGEDMLDGDQGADTLYGGIGNDILNGGGDADWMYGGAGDDTYVVDNPDDHVVEVVGSFALPWIRYDTGGTDIVYSTLHDYELPEAVENLSLYGGVNGTGNSLFNIITGNGEANHLEGRGGGDWLYGEGGADWLVGGEGNDSMQGGEGADQFVVDNGNAIGGDIVDGGSGYDEIWADSSVAGSGLRLDLFPTTAPVKINLTPGISVASDVEAVHGSSVGNDVIDASRLIDESVSIEGFAGDDLFISGGGTDFFNGGAGTDTIGYMGMPSNYTIMAGEPGSNYIAILDRATGVVDYVLDVEFAMFADGSSVDLSALNAAPAAEPTPPPVPGLTLIGTADSDTLTGGERNDRLEGGEGMDFLTGGAGADQLVGGAGTDFLYLDADDTLIDGGDGFDYAYLDSSKSYGANFKVAGTNVEYVGGTLADDVIDAAGVAYRVHMNGNYGNDVLIGGAGNDRLDGSADNDTLTGGAGNDSFYFAGHWGSDTITDFTRGQDVLDMAGVSGLTSMSQLAITSTAQGTSIAYGADSILLQGVTASSLTASDFHFV